ncbi:MAG: hypothetical protein KF773_42785 [Deltaproteobacteria bacterium]|nr:hypothetical protein [Deltaproteobacteria bacterium]
MQTTTLAPSASGTSHGSGHPLEHHPAYRAAIGAAQPIAELAAHLRAPSLVETLAVACCDLALGFAAAPASRRRIAAHHRAWVAVRGIDRAVTMAQRGRRAPPEVLARVRRAVDRAEVLVAALLPGDSA